MTKNYFAIEREGKNLDHVYLRHEDGNIAFEDIMNLSYDEMKAYDNMSEFVTAVMDAANVYFEASDEQTIVTLVGEDDVFIWGILIGPGNDEDELKYVFIDWHKDGKNYRYKKD